MALMQTSLHIGNTSWPHYHICHYLPVSSGPDTYSHSLLRFKLGLQPDLNAWIDCAQEGLAAVPISSHTLITRALHHDETSAQPGGRISLDQLGTALALRFQSHYRPSLLRKYRPTRQMKECTKEQRAAELHDIYYIEDSPGITDSIDPAHPQNPPHSILLLDDVLTTGTTVSAILRALLSRFPDASFTIFTLALALHDACALSPLPIKGSYYQLEPGMNWMLTDPPAS